MSDPLEFERPIAELESKLADLQQHPTGKEKDVEKEIKSIRKRIDKMRKDVYENLTAWQRVQISRHTARPFMLDYVQSCFSDWIELHGDRLFADDKAMPCGFAAIDGHRCIVIGQQKGRNTKENILRNFGCANPEGYRKALRLMRLAEKFRLPLICLIDTPGAYPGIGSEERHISEAIAVNIREMAHLKTPIIAVVIGEGGSGGALGIGVGDRILIMENAYYSVISPEGCAAILWKDRKHAPEAAEALKLDAESLKDLGLVDEIISEPAGGAHHDHEKAAENLREALVRNLEELSKIPQGELLGARYEKFRQMGRVTESGKKNSKAHKKSTE